MIFFSQGVVYVNINPIFASAFTKVVNNKAHGFSSVGRALVSKTRCQEFESLNPCEELFGEMAEWSNAAVLKTVVLRGTGGSNPSLSALKLEIQVIIKFKRITIL